MAYMLDIGASNWKVDLNAYEQGDINNLPRAIQMQTMWQQMLSGK